MSFKLTVTIQAEIHYDVDGLPKAFDVGINATFPPEFYRARNILTPQGENILTAVLCAAIATHINGAEQTNNIPIAEHMHKAVDLIGDLAFQQPTIIIK